MSGCARWPRRHMGSLRLEPSSPGPTCAWHLGGQMAVHLAARCPARGQAWDPPALPPLGRRTPPPMPLPSARGFLAIVSSPAPSFLPSAWAWRLAFPNPTGPGLWVHGPLCSWWGGGDLRQERDGDHVGEDLGSGVLRAAGLRLCPDADASLTAPRKGEDALPQAAERADRPGLPAAPPGEAPSRPHRPAPAQPPCGHH